jgi:hypothetical protein
MPVKKAAKKKPSRVTAKKAAAKKAPPKKVAAKKPGRKTTPSKVTAKKTASRPKASGRKKAAKKVAPPARVREKDEYGFEVGTDSSVIAEELIEGGASRQDINDRVGERIGYETSNGTEKNVPALVSGILNRMLATGEFEVESDWRLVRVERKPRKKGKRK